MGYLKKLILLILPIVTLTAKGQPSIQLSPQAQIGIITCGPSQDEVFLAFDLEGPARWHEKEVQCSHGHHGTDGGDASILLALYQSTIDTHVSNGNRYMELLARSSQLAVLATTEEVHQVLHGYVDVVRSWQIRGDQ